MDIFITFIVVFIVLWLIEKQSDTMRRIEKQNNPFHGMTEEEKIKEFERRKKERKNYKKT